MSMCELLIRWGVVRAAKWESEMGEAHVVRFSPPDHK